ncbi:MAG: flippase-like domain-containing protein [Chloroflexi bacterium]|nr:flippase-like domain-containing protein [Chloroflexota bacterium]
MKTFLQKSKRWLPGAIISIGLIILVLRAVNLNEIASAFKTANLTYILLAGLLGGLWILVRSVVWRTLLENRPSYRDTLISISEGYLMNNVLPFRLGELGRAFLLSEKTDLKFTEILPTIVVERIFDLIVSAAILITALSFVTDAKWMQQSAIASGGIILLGIIALYFIARNQDWALGLFDKLSARIPKLQELGGELVASLLAGLSVFTDSWLFLRFLFWHLFNWGIAILQYILIVYAFVPDATPIWGLFTLGLAAFGNAIPSLPGAIGTLETAIITAITILGGSASIGGSIAVIVRLFNYLFTGIIGFYGFNTEGETLSGIYQKLMDFRKKQN